MPLALGHVARGCENMGLTCRTCSLGLNVGGLRQVLSHGAWLHTALGSDCAVSNAKCPTDTGFRSCGGKRIPEDAQREKAQNKLSVQLLILRFSFCCCARRYKQSEHQGADDKELSQFLPASCMGSEGWLETRLTSTNTQH